jgi:hypothetical protein
MDQINSCVTWTVSRPLLWSIRKQKRLFSLHRSIQKPGMSLTLRNSVYLMLKTKTLIEISIQWVTCQSKWFLLYLGRYWGYPPEPGSCFYRQNIVFSIPTPYRTGGHVYTKMAFACILECLTLINFCVTCTVSRPLLWSIRYVAARPSVAAGKRRPDHESLICGAGVDPDAARIPGAAVLWSSKGGEHTYSVGRDNTTKCLVYTVAWGFWVRGWVNGVCCVCPLTPEPYTLNSTHSTSNSTPLTLILNPKP